MFTTLVYINSCVFSVEKNWLGNLENTLIPQTAQKSGVWSNIFCFETHKEKPFNLCKANPTTKCFRNRCKDKGKPERSSIRYGIKLCHHGTRNRHGMSTRPWKVRTDPNLPICTTSVCAVYVPLPCSNRRGIWLAWAEHSIWLRQSQPVVLSFLVGQGARPCPSGRSLDLRWWGHLF